jgi:hypothetical protein
MSSVTEILNWIQIGPILPPNVEDTNVGYPGRVLCTQYRSTGHSTQKNFAPSEEIYGKELSFSIGGGCYE